MAVTEAERDKYLLNAGIPELAEVSIENWIKQSISDWYDRRTALRKYLDDIRTQQEFKGFVTFPADYENDISSAQSHDDQSLLQNLLKCIGDNEPKIERGKSQNSQMVRKVKDGLQSALDFLKGSPKKSLEDDLTALAIKCAMITYGVTELMKDDGIKNLALYDRLYGNKIWDTAQKLAANIHDHLKGNDDAPNLSELNTTYTELEAALRGEVPILMPDAYHKVFPLVGRIGRAYHAQSLVLASLCHQVASHFESSKNYEARGNLDKALTKTIEAFTAAGELSRRPETNGAGHADNGASTNGLISNGTTSTFTGEYNDGYEKLYNESIEAIKSCFKTMNITDQPDPQEKLDNARTKDKNRLDSYRKRLVNIVTTQETVDLTLIVHEGDGPPINKLQAKVLPTARLSYVKWIAAKELKDMEILHFEDRTQPSVSLDADAQIPIQDNKCTLHLIIKKEIVPKVNGHS
ncbi:unnamed protein product [Rhizoctonia solani]|uniref:Uncharacterized protein n=1 Tax=Rhizoctonia solani TaxID=456999 RepID=A0A8H2WDJ7_9AGAM|nr:unnamed protein product [Rhizoctonia solani]